MSKAEGRGPIEPPLPSNVRVTFFLGFMNDPFMMDEMFLKTKKRVWLIT